MPAAVLDKVLTGASGTGASWLALTGPQTFSTQTTQAASSTTLIVVLVCYYSTHGTCSSVSVGGLTAHQDGFGNINGNYAELWSVYAPSGLASNATISATWTTAFSAGEMEQVGVAALSVANVTSDVNKVQNIGSLGVASGLANPWSSGTAIALSPGFAICANEAGVSGGPQSSTPSVGTEFFDFEDQVTQQLSVGQYLAVTAPGSVSMSGTYSDIGAYEYASVVAVYGPLDYAPIATSDTLVVQILTKAIAADAVGVGESFRISLLSIAVADAASTKDSPTARDELNPTASDASGTSDALSITTGISVREFVVTSEKVIINDLNISTSEVAGTSEQAVVIEGNLVVGASDGVATTETLAEATADLVSRTETTATTESVVALIPLLLVVSDLVLTSELQDANVPITLSERVTIGFVGPVSVGDTTGVAEAPFTTSDGKVSVSEAVVTSDGDVTLLPFTTIDIDTVSASDAVSLQMSDPQVVAAEAVRAQEAPQAFFGPSVFAADACGTSEFVAVQCPGPVSTTDPVTIGDSASAAVVGVFQAALFESLIISERPGATGVLLVSVSDVASLPSGGPVFDDLVSVGDTIGTSEAASSVLSTLFVSAADATTITETRTVRPLFPFSVFVSEQVAGTEFVVVGTAPLIAFTVEAVVADFLATSEHILVLSTSFSRTAADATAISESVAAQQNQYNALAFEAVTTNDRPAIAGDRFVAVADVSGVADNLSGVIGQSAVATDSTSATEAIVIVRVPPLTFSVSASETVVTSEFFVVGMPPNIFFGTAVIAADSLVVSESVSAARSASIADDFVTGLETATTTEALRFSGSSSVAARETTVSSDQAVVEFSFFVTVNDATATSETVAGAIALSSTTGDASTTSETIAAASSGLSASSSEQVGTSEFASAIPLFSFEVDIQENPAVNEALASSVLLEVAVADSTTLVDVNRNERIFLVSSSDSTTPSETLRFSGESVVSVADVSASSEATGISSIVLLETAVDILATTETVALYISVDTSATDAASTADAASANFVSASFDSETVTTQDVLTSRLTSLLSETEVAATREAQLATLISLVQTNESTSVGESVFLEVVAALATVDAVAGTDAAQAFVTIAATTSDAASVTEVIRLAFVGSVGRTEAVTTAESPHVAFNLFSLTSDRIATSESFSARPEYRAMTSDQANVADPVAILPDLLLRASDTLATADAVFPGNDLFRFITDVPSSFEVLVAELSTGLQPTTGLENVGSKEYLALAIKSPWGPLLPADVIPTSDDGDAISIWQSTYRPTQFMPS